MSIPLWLCYIFTFAFGCCIGSFLNVVIYRMPRDESLISPPSACPNCRRHIRFYDNIPLISWLLLGGKCRYCKAKISPQYFIVEFIAGFVFVLLFIIFFQSSLRSGIGTFAKGGWLIYLLHLVLISALIAASGIDLKFFIIPLSICWVITAAGIIGSTLAFLVIEPAAIDQFQLLPTASCILMPSTTVASLTAGAAIGLAVSWLLLTTGLLKRSYDHPDQESKDTPIQSDSQIQDTKYNDRLEICREILFLLPILLFASIAYLICEKSTQIHPAWENFTRHPAVSGLLGSLWAYFIGGGIVWATRILGTLGFGKEAMGLGDVHLMAAAATIVGPIGAVVAFFIAPFFGLAGAFIQMFFKKTRQIPYGPFLSLAVFIVIILHDRIFWYINQMLFHYT